MYEKYEILKNINSPEDVKKLDIEKLKELAGEIRVALLEKLSKVGGHVGPNLGTVELEIAMHYVFNSPKDKFVFDVSHQSYTHKMLTGRQEAYTNPEKYAEVSGYTNPNESEHDMFRIGHTSTSVSLALGLAKGRNLKGEKNNVLAVIGDGSLSGGEAFEGLDYASQLGSNLIIIVNDNGMSIAENHGGLYKNLQLLRETNGKAENNYFKALGLDYKYLADGNSIEELIKLFKEVKDIDHPIVLHIKTLKGDGYLFAEENKETWHWHMPFNIETGKTQIPGATNAQAKAPETMQSVAKNMLINKIKEDKTVVAINAATPGVFGLTPDIRKELGNQYVDVGIAEENAVAMASGVAKAGAKSVFLVNSTFMQRTYDQMSQDLAMNNNPAVILVYGTGISGGEETHDGCFDIPFLSNIPNIVYLAPTTKEELETMFDWALKQRKHPVAIRIAKGAVKETGTKNDSSNYDKLNKFEVEEKGKDVAIIGVGNFFWLAKEVKEELTKNGINASLINPRFLTALDKELLNELKKDHKLVVTLEDGTLDGGFGPKVASFYGDSDVKVLNFGGAKQFTDMVPRAKLLEEYSLTKEKIVEKILNEVK